MVLPLIWMMMIVMMHREEGETNGGRMDEDK
jgi:hypothetical protein